MEWVREAEDATFDFEVLDSKIASGLRKVNATAQKQGRCLIGPQIAWMTYKHFRMSCDSEAVLDFDERIKVQLKSHSVQFSVTIWDDVISAMFE